MDKLSKLRGIAASCEGSGGTINLSLEDAAVIGLEGEPVEGTNSVEVACEDLVGAIQLADLENAEATVEDVTGNATARTKATKGKPQTNTPHGRNKGDSGTPSNRSTGNPTGPSKADHKEE